MKHPRLFWTTLTVFVILLSSWLFASFSYPQTIYDYQQTGELVEWLDRASGWAVDAVPVFVPDNPLWVNMIRRVAPISLFVLALAILYFAVEGRGERDERA